VEIKEDVTVKEYLEGRVPEISAEQVSVVSSSDIEGTELTVRFDIPGDEKQTYGIRVNGAGLPSATFPSRWHSATLFPKKR
jgi:hypothetical protein